MLDIRLCKYPNALLLAGDFNQFPVKFLINYPTTQMVSKPTHGSAIIDKISTNKPHLFLPPSHLAPLGASDHETLLPIPGRKINTLPAECKSVMQIRCNSHCMKENIIKIVYSIDWSPLYRIPNCEEKLDYFYTVINSVLNSAESHLKKIEKPSKPWIMQRFIYLIKQRQKAWFTGDSITYRKLRHLMQQELKKLKKAHLSKQRAIIE